MEKQCFKCKVIKPLTEFYKHLKMKDGTVNKCKDCNKNDVKGNYLEHIKDPNYIEKERKRGREKHHRLYNESNKFTIDENFRIVKTDKEILKQRRLIARQNHFLKFPEKFASTKYNTWRLVTKGFEGHHWSYNIEHVYELIELTPKNHKKAHRFIVYDQERFMYRRFDTNELLDTKEKHEEFILWCIANKED
jgi:hypothetical protein